MKVHPKGNHAVSLPFDLPDSVKQPGKSHLVGAFRSPVQVFGKQVQIDLQPLPEVDKLNVPGSIKLMVQHIAQGPLAPIIEAPGRIDAPGHPETFIQIVEDHIKRFFLLGLIMPNVYNGPVVFQPYVTLLIDTGGLLPDLLQPDVIGPADGTGDNDL